MNESTAREPYNANKQSSYVELVIVVDNDVYKDMNENLDKIHQYCKDIANIINSVSEHELKKFKYVNSSY